MTDESEPDSDSGSPLPPDHEQVWVRPFWRDDDIQVDKGISDVLQAFWKLGVVTVNSCEDNFGKIWVQCLSCTYRMFIQQVFDPAHEDTGLRQSLAWYLGAVELSIYPAYAKYADDGEVFICLRLPLDSKPQLLEFLERARAYSRPRLVEFLEMVRTYSKPQLQEYLERAGARSGSPQVREFLEIVRAFRPQPL